MTFLYPCVFVLSLLPLLSLYVMVKKENQFTMHFSKEMQEKLSLSVSGLSVRYKRWLFVFVLLLFIVALARPVMLLPSYENNENKPALIIAVDVSKSMHSKDIYPTRLTLAMKKLTDFLSQTNHLQAGVILYAKEAYMLYPITQESAILSTLIQDANLSKTFAPNSNLFAALQASQGLLKRHASKQILLLSDGGAEVSREQELNYLQENHISLSTLLLSNKANLAIQHLCKKSGGLSTHYTWSDDDIHTLLTHIQNHSDKAEVFRYDLSHYKELYIYPLWLAVVCLMFLFLPLRRVSFVLIFTLLFIPYGTTPLQAGVFDFWYLNQAKKHTQDKAYAKAIESYKKLTPSPKIHYNMATAYYLNKAYMKSIETYQKALGDDKLYNAKIYYNIATAYIHLHKLSHAKENYAKSLLLYPLKETKENLAEVTKTLKVQKKNLHKAYQKLHFKVIAKNSFVKEATFSHYTVKLNKLIPSEEERWFKRIERQKFQPYLERIPTAKRSLDANLSF
ncbi:MAG: VWA domain-containing protein [Epsilonproteobacteria bacterium]|nr:VWA domain-containing protein [Campylobacterota bacterium]